MAEVFCAELQSQPGYSKMVAIKRVLPRLSRNRLFMRMFLDEARLGLLLNHANIVLVFDVGKAGEDYYIVMEYVDGVDLKTVWDAYAAHGAIIPLEVSLYVAVEICRALDYAHSLSDANYQPLNVVHHDINPSNILISLNGEVKVVDFGLSEAGVHVQKSDPDVVRGKFGYLSPEVACGQGGDHRTDLYALGIIIWEMITGQRMLQGQDDLHALRLAQEANIKPPSMFNPYLSSSLDGIVMAALARDPNDRFQDARTLGRALNQVLFDMGLPVSAFELGDIVSYIRSSQQAEEEYNTRTDDIARMIEEELGQYESLNYDGEFHGPGYQQPVYHGR